MESAPISHSSLPPVTVASVTLGAPALGLLNVTVCSVDCVGIKTQFLRFGASHFETYSAYGAIKYNFGSVFLICADIVGLSNPMAIP
jgi:hypothetical protein